MLRAAELKSLLKAHGLRLTKRLGQNHLIDPRIGERVVQGCGLARDSRVVEIGAGLGALTEIVAQQAGEVLAVEVDRGIAELLRQRMQPYPNVTVACQDILEFDWPSWAGAIVIGAIPYHITSPILVNLSEHRASMPRAVLIVQQEVARRMVAAPGTPAYGRLSVLTQYGWEASKLFDIPPSAFYPQPDVDSTCLRLLARQQPAASVADERWFFEVVKAAFSQRRKTLANCLSGVSARADVERALQQLGVPPAIRGEELSLSQFAALAQTLAKAPPS